MLRSEKADSNARSSIPIPNVARASDLGGRLRTTKPKTVVMTVARKLIQGAIVSIAIVMLVTTVKGPLRALPPAPTPIQL